MLIRALAMEGANLMRFAVRCEGCMAAVGASVFTMGLLAGTLESFKLPWAAVRCTGSTAIEFNSPEAVASWREFEWRMLGGSGGLYSAVPCAPLLPIIAL